MRAACGGGQGTGQPVRASTAVGSKRACGRRGAVCCGNERAGRRREVATGRASTGALLAGAQERSACRGLRDPSGPERARGDARPRRSGCASTRARVLDRATHRGGRTARSCRSGAASRRISGTHHSDCQPAAASGRGAGGSSRARISRQRMRTAAPPAAKGQDAKTIEDDRKLPRPRVKLLGQDGTAFEILGACMRAARVAG